MTSHICDTHAIAIKHEGFILCFNVDNAYNHDQIMIIGVYILYSSPLWVTIIITTEG